MPDWLSIHEPVLMNTIGHCAGAVIFGMLLYLFAKNNQRIRDKRSHLPTIAAALALLWNVGSLVALATGPASGRLADIVAAASFSVLSLLPAVLLHISLESRYRPLWISGYVLSVTAIALHAGDVVTRAWRLHFAALLLMTLGFAWLTLIYVVLEMRKSNRAAISRLAGAMVLFLFAISFVHFGSDNAHQAWSREIALHHAGIPLALFLLLQDYRFLLLDAFLRFVVNASLAAAALLVAIRVVELEGFKRYLENPFDAGLLFVSACIVLTLFVYLRNRTQTFLTGVIFLRSNVEDALRDLRHLGRVTYAEPEYIRGAAEIITRFVRAARFEVSDVPPHKDPANGTAVAVVEGANWNVPSWVHCIVPLRFSRGHSTYLLLGPRDAGRRYLSEDLIVLSRLASAAIEQVEQIRGVQMQKLVSQAELRALQAQINPHFLFNSLNTLYGTIDRSNAEARRLVLNLSDVFRYLLRSDRTFIEIEEELRIIRAYLEIEKLRLGPKLRTEIELDDGVLHATVPPLSIEPLVENAVKHGVASRAGDGFVRLRIGMRHNSIFVEVSNSGECDPEVLNGMTEQAGVGLANVRRRLELCYGGEPGLRATAAAGITTVGFALPLKVAAAVV